MSITFTLPVPLKNQLGEISSDGQPSENDHYDCVATSIADGLQYRLKRPFNGDALKDAVYGQGYVGGMAAIRFVAYCAGLGIALEPINGSQDALLAALHREIEAGNPCLVTMPSQWGSAPSQPGWNPVAPSGWTHVGLACGDGAGMLRVMNPWGGFWHDGTDDYWRVRLCYGQIWRIGPARGATTMAWHKQADGTGKDDKGHVCGKGMMFEIEQKSITANGLRSETYLSGLAPVSAFLTLENGQTLTWDGQAIGYDGAHVIEGLMRAGDSATATMQSMQRTIDDLNAKLAAALAAPQADPLATAALALVKQQKALFAQLP
ncbi:MAG: hypothetical protein ACXWP0_03680 [Ktedonobacterales bacterium]